MAEDWDTVSYMSFAPSVQRSFRLDRRTAEQLDAAAAASGESRNALAERLLREALRLEEHPMIRFRTGAAGRREPVLAGTRLLVRDVIATLREHGNHVDATADYFGVPRGTLVAAAGYYADFADEVDADAQLAEAAAQRERERWERQRALLGRDEAGA